MRGIGRYRFLSVHVVFHHGVHDGSCLYVHRRGFPVDVFHLRRGELCACLESPRTVVGDYSIHTTLVVCFCQVYTLPFSGRVLLGLFVLQPLPFLQKGVHHPRKVRMIGLHSPSSPKRVVGWMCHVI